MFNPLTIGGCMKLARIDLGVSRAELERRSGVSRYTIRSAECGYTMPTILTMISLAEGLGIGLDEYIGREIPEE